MSVIRSMNDKIITLFSEYGKMNIHYLSLGSRNTFSVCV